MAHTHVPKAQSGVTSVPVASTLLVQAGYPASDWVSLEREGSFLPFTDLRLPGGRGASDYVVDDGSVSAPAVARPGQEAFGGIYVGGLYGLLERQRPDIALLARFAHSVEFATFHMCVAFDLAGIDDFDLDFNKNVPNRGAKRIWFAALAEATFARFKTLRKALTFEWTPPVEVEPLTYSAFISLCDLTPASSHYLKQLFFSRRTYALQALVKQLDVTAGIIETALQLRSDAADAINDRTQEDDANRLAATQADILSKAGDALGLRPAAERLGMSHQNLHKRIGNNSALGVMRDRQLIVPSVQFVQEGDGEKIVPELRQVLAVFAEASAGTWSALQYLTEQDPVLGATPIDVLKAGNADAVVAAARAYLGVDEV